MVPIVLDSNGYYRLTLWRDDKSYIRCIHKLVALNWIVLPSKDQKLQVDHINHGVTTLPPRL